MLAASIRLLQVVGLTKNRHSAAAIAHTHFFLQIIDWQMCSSYCASYRSYMNILFYSLLAGKCGRDIEAAIARLCYVAGRWLGNMAEILRLLSIFYFHRQRNCGLHSVQV